MKTNGQAYRSHCTANLNDFLLAGNFLAGFQLFFIYLPQYRHIKQYIKFNILKVKESSTICSIPFCSRG